MVLLVEVKPNPALCGCLSGVSWLHGPIEVWPSQIERTAPIMLVVSINVQNSMGVWCTTQLQNVWGACNYKSVRCNYKYNYNEWLAICRAVLNLFKEDLLIDDSYQITYLPKVELLNLLSKSCKCTNGKNIWLASIEIMWFRVTSALSQANLLLYNTCIQF